MIQPPWQTVSNYETDYTYYRYFFWFQLFSGLNKVPYDSKQIGKLFKMGGNKGRFWEAFSNGAWESFQLPFPVSQLPRESASHQLKTKTTLEEEN